MSETEGFSVERIFLSLTACASASAMAVCTSPRMAPSVVPCGETLTAMETRLSGSSAVGWATSMENAWVPPLPSSHDLRPVPLFW